MASAARVVFGVQTVQTLACHMGVDGGGGNIRVAQQHLHRAQVGAVVQ